MSFFDEVDEPRTAPRRRRPSATGRPPPTDRQAIQVRRIVAAVAILAVLILIVLGVRGCQASARKSALQDYTNSVSSLIQSSDQTAGGLFGALTSPGGAGNAAMLQTSINNTRASADLQLSRAKGLSVPDEMRGAQQDLLLVMQMRRDGIANIATEIPAALGNTANRDAANSIATQMARFYASDVVYKSYAASLIAGALNGAGIAVGGPNGESIDSGQFLPDVGWLSPTFVMSKLGVSSPAAGGKPAPGLHGHSLGSVSVGGTTLQTGSTNTLPASPAPTFTLSFTNGGTNTETNVKLTVTVSGTSSSGQTIVPQTTPGEHATGQVTLATSPPAGTYTVTATVQSVPGEQDKTNNSLSFPVTFR